MQLLISYSLVYREKQLKALLRLYKDHELEMCEALAKDLNKNRQEAIINEVEFLRNDVISLLMNFRTYAKTENVCKEHHIVTTVFEFRVNFVLKSSSDLNIYSQKKHMPMQWIRWNCTKIRLVLC